jgi:serine/threonine-protein kinase
VHRDIKPGNVMVTSSGQVKVMDFRHRPGDLRLVRDDRPDQRDPRHRPVLLSRAGTRRGGDARTDLYSTGVVLYELLTGRPPFIGETAVATAYQHVSEAPTRRTPSTPAVSPALNAVVMRSLAKDRVERYQTAADFRSDLEIALAGKVPDRGPVADDFNSTLFGVNPELDARVGGDPAPPRRRHRRPRPAHADRPPVAWIWGIIALLGVVIVAAASGSSTCTPTTSSAGVAVEVPTSWPAPTRTAATSCSPSGSSDQGRRPSDDVPRGTILAARSRGRHQLGPGQEVRCLVSSGPPRSPWSA